MKKFYIQGMLYWFILLAVAFINAGIRETTYKPLLTPYIGNWAHQLSVIFGIGLFFVAIYLFLRYTKAKYNRKDVIFIGLFWVIVTFLFETGMNYFIQKMSIVDILGTYHFWEGELWIFVIFSLLISPLIVYEILNKKR